MSIRVKTVSFHLPLLSIMAFTALTASAEVAAPPSENHLSDILINKSSSVPTVQEPITVIADVHGDFGTMFQLLHQAKIINQKGNWVAGKRTLVSLGDLVDRGPDSRKILDFFMRLEKQAEDAGGAFVMALGNHEVMNIRGDLRYVSDAEFSAFAEDESKRLRKSVYKDFLNYSQLEDSDESKAKFLKLYPPGFFAHVKAYAPDGKYGSWLLKKSIIIKLQNKLFAHGGLSTSLVDTRKSLRQINKQLISELTDYSNLWRELIKAGLFKYYFSKRDRVEVAQALIDGKIQNRALTKKSIVKKARQFIELSNSLLFSSFGPTWYRGNMYCHEFTEENTVNAVLNYFSANQIFLGHTPDNSLKVRSRFQNRVVMLDTGMSQAYYKGNPSVVNLDQNGISVFNINDEQNTSPLVSGIRKPIRPNGYSDDYLRDYYSKAKVIEEKQLGDFYTKPLRLIFDLDGVQHRAIFKYLDTDPKLEKKRWNRIGNYADRYINDIAAYKLDQLLGLNMVPFVMEYQYDNKRGIIQYWVEDSVTKTDLIENKQKLKGYCKPEEARELMQVFDWLIHNEDRNTGNELYTEPDAQLWLIDHTRSFRVSSELIHNKHSTLPHQISKSLKRALIKLNRTNLETELGKYLNPKQIDSILKRRDLILERFN